MAENLTEEDILASIPGLTRTRLFTFIEAELVIPLQGQGNSGSVHVFRRIDCARVRLLCDLSDDLDLDEAALGIVITLIDQLHSNRRDLLAFARAVEAEVPEVRARIGAAILGHQR